MENPKENTPKLKYAPLTLTMAINLAAPQTWAASIIPVAFAVALSSISSPIIWPAAWAMLAIVILMQSAVNTFNDYFDFMKGTDSADDAVEVSDAVLVYENVNPRVVLALGIGFLIAAFLLGIYPIILAGYVPLIIALIGALMVVLYSWGRTPLSYLPLGELVSGFTMGGLVPLAVVYVLTGTLDFFVLLWSLPLMLGIASIMATNNISDIERDKSAHRKTLAVMLGRPRARVAYGFILGAWILSLVLIGILAFRNSWVLLPFALVASWPSLQTLIQGNLEPKARPRSMGAITGLNITLGAFYVAMVFASMGLYI